MQLFYCCFVILARNILCNALKHKKDSLPFSNYNILSCVLSSHLFLCQYKMYPLFKMHQGQTKLV